MSFETKDPEIEDGTIALPPLPAIAIKAVLERRDNLIPLVEAYAGSLIEGQNYESMISDIRVGLPDAKVSTLYESLRFVTGRVLKREEVKNLCWRLAGNYPTLKKGIAMAPWSRQETVEWVPVQVTSTRYALHKYRGAKFHRPGTTFRFTFLTGSLASTHLLQFWSYEKTSVVANAIGFRRAPPYFLGHSSELFGMRMFVLLDPKRSKETPGFLHVSASDSILDHNRSLINKRRRLGFTCPEGFSHECHQCYLGRRSCESATHLEDYESKECVGCGRTWWFDTDPTHLNDFCIHCQPLKTAGLPLRVIKEQGDVKENIPGEDTGGRVVQPTQGPG